MVRFIGGSVCLLALTASALVHALPNTEPRTTPPELSWVAPAACPNAAEFRERIRAYLGQVSPAPTTLSGASARVAVEPGGFRVNLRVEQQGQLRERLLHTKTCMEALDAAALVVALAIDPNAATRSNLALLPASTAAVAAVSPHPSVTDANGQCPCAPVTTTCEPCPPAPITLPSPCPSPPQQAHVQAPTPTAKMPESRQASPFSLHLESELGIQQLPGVSLGMGLGAALDIHRLRLSVTLVTHRSVRRQAAGLAGDFRLVQGRAGACWFSAGTLAAGPCAALGVGTISGAGLGVDVPERAIRAWASASLGAMLRYSHRDVAIVGVYVNAEVPIVRPVFDLLGTEFYRPPMIGVLPGILVGVRF